MCRHPIRHASNLIGEEPRLSGNARPSITDESLATEYGHALSEVQRLTGIHDWCVCELNMLAQRLDPFNPEFLGFVEMEREMKSKLELAIQRANDIRVSIIFPITLAHREVSSFELDYPYVPFTYGHATHSYTIRYRRMGFHPPTQRNMVDEEEEKKEKHKQRMDGNRNTKQRTQQKQKIDQPKSRRPFVIQQMNRNRR